MKTRLAVLLCLLLPIQLSAADKWTSVHSANFTLVGNATEAQIRSVAVELEQFRDAFMQALGLTSKPATTTTTVVVLKNDESFRPFDVLAVNGKPSNSAGYFQASEDVSYMALKAGGSVPRVVYHQYAHELMRDLPGAAPLWFTEGMAEFFSNFEIKDKQFALGKVISEHMDTLRKGPFIDR